MLSINTNKKENHVYLSLYFYINFSTFSSKYNYFLFIHIFSYQFSIYFIVNRKKYQRLKNLNSIWFIIKKNIQQKIELILPTKKNSLNFIHLC